MAALEPRKTRGITLLDPAKERLKRLVEPGQSGPLTMHGVLSKCWVALTSFRPLFSLIVRPTPHALALVRREMLLQGGLPSPPLRIEKRPPLTVGRAAAWGRVGERLHREMVSSNQTVTTIIKEVRRGARYLGI